MTKYEAIIEAIKSLNELISKVQDGNTSNCINIRHYAENDRQKLIDALISDKKNEEIESKIDEFDNNLILDEEADIPDATPIFDDEIIKVDSTSEHPDSD